MKHGEYTERMHAVLDGTASPERARELTLARAADAAVQAEFVQWQHLFETLGRMPQALPPEGLVAAVTAAAAQRIESMRAPHQLFAHSHVIEHRHPGDRGVVSRIRATLRRPGRSESTRESQNMSEQQRSGFGNRKLWAGGAVAAVAIGVAMIAFDFPPKSENLAGTIAPAERYRAPGGAERVKLGDQTVAQLMQNDGFDRLIKDPQMQALSQDAGIRALASALARMPLESRVMLEHLDASRAAADNIALAKAMLANVDISRTVAAELKADRVAPEHADLARQMSANLQASMMMLGSIEAARMASAYPQLAKAIAANAQASRMLMSTDANRISVDKAQADRMLQSAEANRADLQRIQTERATQ